jgi:hypothetical protein
MTFADRFISTIGRMPFTAKHSARHLYTEATRAAIRGNEAQRRSYAARLGGIALCNDGMMLTGAILSGLSVNYAVSHNSPAFALEAIGCALYAIGHGASGVAQHLMVRRHDAQAEAIAARRATQASTEQVPAAPAPIIAPGPVPRPTLTERIVTNGGTALTLLPVAHIAVNELLLHR